MPLRPAARTAGARLSRGAAGLLAVSALLTACSSAPAEQERTVALPSSAPSSPAAAPTPAPVSTAVRARAASDVLPVKPLARRLTADVLVRASSTMSPGALRRLAALSPAGGTAVFRAGTVRLAGKPVGAVGVDPSTFRAFAAQGTAEATAVWQAVARGEAVASHAVSKSRALPLGGTVEVADAGSGPTAPLRLGALASTGIPQTDLLLDDETARDLGLRAATGMLLTAGKDVDPVVLARQVRAVTGAGARVDLLTPPAANPVAFLTGSRAAKAFGAFSYRYFPDGTIQPDASWVAENIRTATVPLMGRVTCHKLMIPQLRGALQEVVDRGLGGTLHSFDGCYVPRFIERNPARSISLHTWGIAIDMDASTNYRGIKGTMDPQVVAVFKRWGFRWGGDWAYTDPMHFEMGAILTSPQG